GPRVQSGRDDPARALPRRLRPSRVDGTGSGLRAEARPAQHEQLVRARTPHPHRGLEQQLPALRPQSQHGRQQLRRNRGRRRAQRGAPLDAVPLADPADRRARRPTHEAMMATVRVAAVLTAMLLGGAGPAAAQQDLRVYVPNQMGASITVLDGEGRTLETVDLRALGFSAHAMPHQVAAEADGAAWYVTL